MKILAIILAATGCGWIVGTNLIVALESYRRNLPMNGATATTRIAAALIGMAIFIAIGGFIP